MENGATLAIYGLALFGIIICVPLFINLVSGLLIKKAKTNGQISSIRGQALI